MEIRPASRPRRVVVVGGGVAARGRPRRRATRSPDDPARGDQRRRRPSPRGGQGAKREDYASIATWLVDQAKKAGAEIRLNTPAFGPTSSPQATTVVLATAHAARARHPGVRLPHVATTVDVLTGRTAPAAASSSSTRRAIAAPRRRTLAERGRRSPSCAVLHGRRGHRRGTRSDLYARLFARGVTLIPMTVAREILPQGVRTRHTFSNAEATLAATPWSSPSAARRTIRSRASSRQGGGPQGDRRRVLPAPRHDAILDGTRAARML